MTDPLVGSGNAQFQARVPVTAQGTVQADEPVPDQVVTHLDRFRTVDARDGVAVDATG